MSSTSSLRRVGHVGSIFWVSIAICAAFVAYGSAFPGTLNSGMNAAQNWVTRSFGWLFLLTSLGLLVTLVVLAASRVGKIRLGPDDSRPEFATWSWYAMILSAVMGIGMVSYGVAEPISHYYAPPHGLAGPETPGAAVTALQYSFFDWGLHAWAIFATVGLAMAYSTHRKGRRGLVSQIFRPLIGDRVDGPIGKSIDVFSIFATLFGTTTSLGLGALQIDSGLGSVLGTPTGRTTQVVIIAIVTILFTASAVTGVHKGIKYLSETSMGLATALFVFVLLAGPTVFVINLMLQSFGVYVTDFFAMSLQGSTFGNLGWMQGWTLFMMAWWVSWGAFVGVFLAKISRGRTVRQFIVGVLTVPSVVFFGWFSVMGGTAISIDRSRGKVIGVVTETGGDLNSAFFLTLDQLPLSTVTSITAILLVVLFFVSGADANTYVLSMMSTNGALTPPTRVLVLWGVLTGLAAIVLLFADGLQALQTTAIVTSAPFLVIIVLLAISFIKELHQDLELTPPRSDDQLEGDADPVDAAGRALAVSSPERRAEP